MTTVSEYALTLIVLVSTISLATVMLAALNSRNPAKRHAIGVLGLMLVLSGPLLALLLPGMALVARTVFKIATEYRPGLGRA